MDKIAKTKAALESAVERITELERQLDKALSSGAQKDWEKADDGLKAERNRLALLERRLEKLEEERRQAEAEFIRAGVERAAAAEAARREKHEAELKAFIFGPLSRVAEEFEALLARGPSDSGARRAVRQWFGSGQPFADFLKTYETHDVGSTLYGRPPHKVTWGEYLFGEPTKADDERIAV
jgi:DNA repair exonuclease SbcCD ATPase subunit